MRAQLPAGPPDAACLTRTVMAEWKRGTHHSVSNMSMRIHLIETGRHRPWHAGSTVWSTSAHAALVASVVAGAVPARTHGRVEREVVYLLPTLPSAPRRAPDAS